MKNRSIFFYFFALSLIVFVEAQNIFSDEEFAAKTFLFSSDSLTEDNEDLIAVRVFYDEESNLLKSRLTYVENRIVKREFFHHDPSGSLIQAILDDGCSESVDDLSEVTERHLKKITPTRTFPFGYPQIVQEFCLDLSTGNYLLLKKTQTNYDIRGHKCLEEHYGSNDSLAFTLRWRNDFHGNHLVEQDAVGNLFNYKYDSNLNKIEESHPDFTKYYTYDASKRLIEEKEVADDGFTLITTHRYNHLGQKIATIDAYGNELLYSYDSHGHLVEIVHPPINGIKPIERRTYDKHGNRLSTQDPLGNVTRTEYTSLGHPSLIEYPDGSIEKKEYSNKGRLIKEIAKNGLVTVYKRDPFGRITSCSTFSPSGHLLKSTSATYNMFHCLSETDEKGCVTRYFYDSAGRIALKEKEDKRTQYVYDHLGRLAIEIEWLNQQQARLKRLSYDNLNRITEEQIEEIDGHVFKRTLYAYDNSGNVSVVTTFTEEGPAASLRRYTLQNKPTFEQDPLGNITKTSYEFTQRSLKTTHSDSLGNKEITFTDAYGNLLEKCRQDASNNILQKETYCYDLCKRLISKTTLDGVKKWEWDSMGRLVRCIGIDTKVTSHTYNSFGQRISTLLPNNVTFTFEYDDLGRMISKKSSDGTINTFFAYDENDNVLMACNLLENTATHRTFDIQGRLSSEILETGHKTYYGYDNLDRLMIVAFPDGSSVYYDYSGCQLNSIERIKDGIIVYSHSILAYDLSGNPIKEQLIDGSILKRRFDPLNRIISIISPHREETLSYDKIGNLIEHSVNGSKMSYGEKNSGSVNQVISQNNTTYVYDENGNLTEIENGDQATLFFYDALNRLTEVVNANYHASYTYDAFDRRLTKTLNGHEEQYFYQNESEIGAKTSDGLRELRLLDNKSATIAIEMDNIHFAAVNEFFGNIAHLLDSEHNPCYLFQSSKAPWSYLGKRYDEETGFFYCGKGYSDPEFDRLITADILN